MLKTIGLILVGLLAGHARAASVCPEAPNQFGMGNMLGCWTLNDESSGIFEDNSSNEHHAVASGAYSVITGLDGGAVSIAGDGYLDLPGLHDSLDTTRWSVSFWFRSAAADSQMVFQQSTNGYLQAVVVVGGRPGYLVQNPADTTLFLGSASSLNDGEWHHVVFTRGNSVSRQFYVDGVLISTTRNTVSGWIPSGRFLDRTSLGSPDNSLFPVNGDLDDVLLVSRNLNNANVSWIYDWTFSTPNTPPVYSSSPSLTTQEGILYTYEVAVSDPDAGQTVTLTLQQGPTGMSLDGSLLTWTPENTQVGDHVVQLQADDGVSEPVIQQFTLTVLNVNDPPQFTSSPPLTAMEGVAYEYTPLFSDPDEGQPLILELRDGPTGMTLVSGETIRWTPGNSQVGQHTVSLRVTDDSSAFATQSFTLTVTNVNNPPVITSEPSLNGVENLQYQYQVVVADPDLEASHTYLLTENPNGMTITTAGLIRWTPGDEHIGENNVSVLVTDNGGATVTQSFTLTVANVNDVPQITSAPVTEATEDELYTYQLEVFDPDPGDTITFRLGNAPSGMSIDFTGRVTWLPGDAHIGPNDVTILVSDGSGTNVSQDYVVTVANVNDVPVIISIPPTAAIEGVLYTYQITVSDPDPGETFTYHIVLAPAGLEVSTSGLVEWTPGSSQIGSNRIVLQVRDQAGADVIQSFRVTVENANDIPQIISDPVTEATEEVLYTYRVEVFNPDAGETITFRLGESPSGMTIDEDGNISWIPNNNHIGSNNVIVLVSDGSGINVIQEFAVTVINVNAPPVIISDAPTVATINLLYTYNLSVLDPDPGEVLTYILENGPVGMTLSETGVLRWTPTQDDGGEHTVTIIVRDNALAEDSQTFLLNVQTVNTPPAISTSALPAGTEDQPYTFQLTGTDPEGSPLLWTLLLGPEEMTLSAKGLLEYTPPLNANGEFNLRVLASDGVRSAIKDFSLYFIPVNDPPQIDSTVPKSQVYRVGQQVLFPLTATDPEGQELTWSLLNPPEIAYISSNLDFIWIPSIQQLGLDTLSFVVSDGELSDTLQHFALVLANLVDVHLTNPDRLEFHVKGGELVINLPLQDAPAVFQVFDPLGRSLFSRRLDIPGTHNLSLERLSAKSWCILTVRTPKHQFIQKIRL